MDELDRHLRELVDAAAVPVTADEIRDRTTTRLRTADGHRRRPHRLLGVAAAIVLLAGAVTWTARRDHHDRVITDDRTRTTTTVLTVPDYAGFEIVMDETLYDLGIDPPRAVDLGVRPTPAPNAEPVRTNNGLVTLTALDRSRGDLVIVGPSGPRTIERGVYAFAVDATGTRVVYATAPQAINQPGGTTTLTVARLDIDRVESRLDFRGIDGSGSNATPVGWAGPYVMLNTGDGAGSRAAYWTPGEPTVTAIGNGTVVLTDPTAARAVIAFGDSGCGSVHQRQPDGSWAPVLAGLPPICQPVAISPSGHLLATINDAGDIKVTTLNAPTATNTEWPGTATGGTSAYASWFDEQHFAFARVGELVICARGGLCRSIGLDSASNPTLVAHRVAAPPVAPTTSTAPPTTRPPLSDVAVAITTDEVHIIDTRTGAAVHKTSLRAALSADGRARVLDFVEISPDKNTAVVTAAENGGSRYSLWTVNLRTDAVAMLSDDAIWPAFSPDGTTLSYTRSQGPREGGDTIVLRDLATGRERSLKRSGVDGLSRVSSPVWSPDGRTLAYTYGYYGADTYLIDPATATDLDNARKLDNVAFIDWREPDTALVSWFCCFEAEPPVVSTYVIGTGAHTSAGTPESFGFINRNDQDGRLAGVDQSTGNYTVRYTDTSGTLAVLPGYRHLAW